MFHYYSVLVMSRQNYFFAALHPIYIACKFDRRYKCHFVMRAICSQGIEIVVGSVSAHE